MTTNQNAGELVKRVTGEMEHLGAFLPRDKLQHLLRRPILQMAEPVEFLLPSLELAKDGVALSSVILVTSSFICEVDVAASGERYDFVRKNTIANIRCSLWTHQIKDQDTVKANYYLATIKWMHTRTSDAGLATKISFAGESEVARDDWLSWVFTAMPTSAMY